MEYYPLPLTIGDLDTGFRPTQSPVSIFVAYDFKEPESEKFFADLRSRLAHSPRDAAIDVTNGRVDPAQTWAVEVRERISRSRVTIADLSLRSVEVYFECGLAWGLGRVLCPVVRDQSRREHVPKWMHDLQIVDYSTTEGMNALVTMVRRLASERARRARDRTESAVPGKVSLLAYEQEKCNAQNELIKSACGVFGMDFVASPCLGRDDLSVDLPRDVADASLLVANLGPAITDENLFSIFAAGAVLANPSSGVSGRNLIKQVVFVANDISPSSVKIFPESAKSLRKNAKIIGPSQLTTELHSFGASYQRWQAQQRALPAKVKRASTTKAKRS